VLKITVKGAKTKPKKVREGEILACRSKGQNIIFKGDGDSFLTYI
jgi:hypothetical protein